jgi:hypothetical protein
VIKVGKLWSWLARSGKVSGSSRRDGLPYKGLPPIPVPKPRNKAGHSLVIISASGNTRQIDLTPFRMRICILAGIALVVLVLLSVFSISPLIRVNGGSTTAGSDSSEKIEALKEELRQKDLALSVQEKRLKEMRETPTLAAIGQRQPAPQTNRSMPKAEQPAETESPLMSLQDSSKTEVRAPAGEDEEEAPGTQGVAQPRVAARSDRSEPVGGSSTQTARNPGAQDLINFDAQEVVAAPKNRSSGTVSFRLIKDAPEIRFSGYLFVFVEMSDQRGENSIWAYPKQTRLGDGDLPADYRDGETLSFKYNQRVELPYADPRTGSSLARVSIILYSENGKIVFQRGFDRREIKIAPSKSAVEERSRQGVEKRRAL